MSLRKQLGAFLNGKIYKNWYVLKVQIRVTTIKKTFSKSAHSLHRLPRLLAYTLPHVINIPARIHYSSKYNYELDSRLHEHPITARTRQFYI